VPHVVRGSAWGTYCSNWAGSVVSPKVDGSESYNWVTGAVGSNSRDSTNSSNTAHLNTANSLFSGRTI
jgi:hypothetical protein